MSWKFLVEDVIDEVVEDVRSELSHLGIFFGDVEGLDTYGARIYTIIFKEVNVNLENRELQRVLSETCGSWKRLFDAFALEKLISGGGLNIYDYVDVEEISWSRCHGPYVRLNVSNDVEELLQKYGLDDIDVREMEESLEGILDHEARRILRELNKTLQEAMSEDCHACGKTAFV